MHTAFVTPLRLTFFDETLRDGIQSPSVRDPSIDDKKEILRLTASLGITFPFNLTIGIPLYLFLANTLYGFLG
jgi:hypothetical protein